MTPISAPPREAASARANTLALGHRAAEDSTFTTARPSLRARPGRNATDDEILGWAYPDRGVRRAAPEDAPSGDDQLALDFDEGNTPDSQMTADGDGASPAESNAGEGPAALQSALNSNPELRRAWQEAQAYRETFATPAEAKAATALLADLDRMDALFFSRRPEDHAELARSVAALDPVAFASLSRAINDLTTESQRRGEADAGKQGSATSPSDDSQFSQRQQVDPQRRQESAAPERLAQVSAAGPTPAQVEFFHGANAAAVQGVIEAVESQVEKLLPEGVSKSARNRVVGEIYRELDTALRSNRQLAGQMRDAFQSGSLDGDHQRAVVSLITARAKQALPGVAKRVLGEWTSTIVAANHDRRARQRAAERRVDIAGSNGAGSDARRPADQRNVDYSRMSDADILNL